MYASLRDAACTPIYIEQPEWRRRFPDVTEHLTEERFMLRCTDPQTCLRHEIAKRHGCSARLLLPQQVRLHLAEEHFSSHMIQGEMVK